MRHLREIMKQTWKDKVSNHEIYRRSGLAPTADMLIERNLRWTGHVHRIDEKILPRQLIYSELSSGKRNQGRPRLRFKDVVKKNLNGRGIKHDTWQSAANRRPIWKAMIHRPKLRTVIVNSKDCL